VIQDVGFGVWNLGLNDEPKRCLERYNEYRFFLASHCFVLDSFSDSGWKALKTMGLGASGFSDCHVCAGNHMAVKPAIKPSAVVSSHWAAGFWKNHTIKEFGSEGSFTKMANKSKIRSVSRR
jgi:hypothetical protein